MKIKGPLVIDVSKWNDHLNIKELEDGGVVSVILGLYKSYINGQYVLNYNCHRIIDQISASNLLLQTYCYYYPHLDPIIEANWFLNAMKGYPVKYAWADLENHEAVMTPLLRSEQNRRFTEELHSHFLKSGVYTANWYTDAYCTTTLPDGTTVNEMDKWLTKYTAWVPHYGHEPRGLTMMTWDDLKDNWLPDYDIILSKGQLEYLVVGHQFTGDRCILPGTYQLYNSVYGGRMALDVSVFKQEFINGIKGVVNPIPPTPPPAPVTNAYTYGINPANGNPILGLNVRKEATQTSALVKVLYKSVTPIFYVDITMVKNGYVMLADKTGWIFLAYIKKV